jgi:hypothetical protein
MRARISGTFVTIGAANFAAHPARTTILNELGGAGSSIQGTLGTDERDITHECCETIRGGGISDGAILFQRSSADHAI